MSLKWGDLPEDDPIFSGTHFVFFAGPLLQRVTPGEEELEFVSPKVPERMRRRPSTPPSEETG